MTTSATTGAGCLLQRYNGSSYVTVAEVKGVKGPSLAGGTVDVTSFDSANHVREFIATLRDPGTMSFTINYLPTDATHSGLISDLLNGTTRAFKLVLSNVAGTYLSFNAIVTGFEIDSELEQALSANVTMKLSGWPTWT